MGAPLLIGGATQEPALGVIRVLNRKARDYSAEHPRLADEGFTKQDFELLKVIATQIASAIRNANYMESSEHFKRLVESSPDPIIVLDNRGRIRTFNHACVLIWQKDADKVIGDHVANYYESFEHAKKIMDELEKKQTVQNYEARIRDAHDTIIPIRLSASLLYDSAGNFIGSIGVFKDERPILELEKAKILAAKFAAGRVITENRVHDLKHDLGTIMNWTDTFDLDNADDDAIEAIDGIRAAVRKMISKLNAELLSVDLQPTEREVISLTELLRDFEESVSEDALMSNIRFEVALPQDEIFVFANAEQLQQVFANLFGNSLDAVKERFAGNEQSSGAIRAGVASDNGSVRITWSDNGPGMTEEAAAKAFTPYFSTKEYGSGMGLFITQRVLEFHGGSITMIPPAEGEGVCFHIVLPTAARSSGETT
jgi:PAS domain S-box-containing protein